MLFYTHIDFCHFLWKEHITTNTSSNTVVLDATAGRGLDTLFLANVLTHRKNSKLISLDIQETALCATRKRLNANGIKPNSESNTLQIDLIHKSHEDLSEFLSPEEADLIIYNLGYLPGGNKSITTLVDTTQKSLKTALHCLRPSGLITVTFYPGHEAGSIEKDEIVPKLFEEIDSINAANSDVKWSISFHTFSMKKRSPCVLVLQKHPKTIES